MGDSPTGLRGWLMDLENVILWRICEWIINRRGVSFIYWTNPPKWEEFLADESD